MNPPLELHGSDTPQEQTPTHHMPGIDPPFAAARILIVEDEATVADAFGSLLEGHGYRTEIVRHPDEVLPAVRRFRPDVILLDIGLPDRSGFDVAIELAGLDERRRFRVIALSGYSKDDRCIQGNQHFDDRLEKPVKMKTLLRAVANT